jgi:hypothetical protein
MVSPTAAFVRAAAVCRPAELWVRVGSYTMLISVAGPRHAERLFDPFRHIEIDPPDGPPDLEISAWSVAETGISPPAEVTWQEGEPLEWIAPDGRRIVTCLPSAQELQRVSIARPFQWALVTVFAKRNLPALHGGLIAASGDGPGLLLVGPNRSGKSTTCLSALQAGFRLVGEDILVVERMAHGYVGHSLYRSCNLTSQARQLFSSLPGPLQLPHGSTAEDKAVLMLPMGSSSSSMCRTLSIGALVFPVITGAGGDSRAISIPKGEAYRRFVPALRQTKKLSEDERRAHHDAIVPMVTELPSFRLDLGADVTAVPPVLEALLRTL